MEIGRWMIYGANGYTGRLIAEEAARRGLKPVLAGRREKAIAPLARRLELEPRVFDLDATGQIARRLRDIHTVLLAAGPYSATSGPVVEACLQTRTNYLDFTGEVSVFEAIFARGGEAERAGVTLLPGVGFDVVPTDCLSAALAERLPGAVELEVAFRGVGGPSKGTAKTMIEGLPQGLAIRRQGEIRWVHDDPMTLEVPFRDKPRSAMSVSWGDVSTAYHSTGIPNITAYMAVSPDTQEKMRSLSWVGPLMRFPPARKLAQKLIELTVKGPDEATRRQERSQIWARVRDAEGQEVTGTLETPEAYQLTVLTALESALRVAQDKVPAGALTPSRAFGPGYITEFEGCEMEGA